MASLKYIFLFLLHQFGRIVGLITTPIFRWLYEGQHRLLPAADNPLLMKSATTLSRMIRNKEVTSEEVVGAFIKRIKVVNPYLNAVVADRFDEAIEEAKKVDEILSHSEIPDEYSPENAPFLGVPLTTKEAISIAGLPNTSGLLRRSKVISIKDADAIACLRKAGAIPIAVTNISELCMWYESNNLIYGRCNNAYHQGRMVGGSSGGEGCLQSSGGSAMGIGSDIGGSIRMPCFFNGVFGHKCSTGVVSNAGQFPNAKAGAQHFIATGPMVRFAEDIMPMFKLQVLDQHKDKLKLDEPVDVKKLKYFYMEDDGGGLIMSPVHPEIKEAVRKAAKHFESLGCEVRKVSIPELKQSLQLWQTMMTTSGDDTFCTLMANEGPPVNPFKELLLWLIGQRRHTLPAIGLGMVEKIKARDEVIENMKQKREELLERFQSLLSNDAVFLYPTHPIPAPYHNQPLVVIFNFAYTGVFNVLGLPATAVPMGLAKEEGVPIGLQVVGSRYQDRLCIAVARELETAFGGWVPPFEVVKS